MPEKSKLYCQEFIVHSKVPNHVIVELAANYVDESQLKIESDLDGLYSYVSLLKQSPAFDVIMLRREEEHIILEDAVIGFAVVAYEPNWSKDILASVMLLYVQPKHRSTYAFYQLIRSCREFAKARGAKYMFVNSVGKISGRATEAFELMCERMGFEKTSPTFTVEL
jgi:hypothetical protein